MYLMMLQTVGRGVLTTLCQQTSAVRKRAGIDKEE
jgi:hypothetical protein